MTLRFVVKSPWVCVEEKSPPQAKSTPARMEGHSGAYEKRGLAAARNIINTCGHGADSPSRLAKYEAGRGPRDGASNLRPTLGRGSAELAKYLRRGRRDAAWAPLRPSAAAPDFQTRKAPKDFHSYGSRTYASRPDPSVWRRAFLKSRLQILHLFVRPEISIANATTPRHTSREIHIAISENRVLKPLRNQPRLSCSHAVQLFPVWNSASVAHILRGRESLNCPPFIQFRSPRHSRGVRAHTKLGCPRHPSILAPKLGCAPKPGCPIRPFPRRNSAARAASETDFLACAPNLSPNSKWRHLARSFTTPLSATEAKCRSTPGS